MFTTTAFVGPYADKYPRQTLLNGFEGLQVTVPDSIPLPEPGSRIRATVKRVCVQADKEKGREKAFFFHSLVNWRFARPDKD